MTGLKHFKMSEFDCKCCGKADMDMDFLRKLDIARETAGIPFIITSGYRCEKHNRAVGGSPTSTHPEGIAADILCDDSVKRFKIINALLAVGFKRIGIGKDFIHVDDKQTVISIIWVYK